MDVSYLIDWLSFTLKNDDHPSTLFPLCHWKYVGKGHYGYRSAFVCTDTGLRCEQDSLDSEMGSHYQLSGDTIRRYCSTFGLDDTRLSAYVSRQNAVCTRLDLAMDFHQAKLTPALLKGAVKRQRATFKGSSWRWIEGKNGAALGSTLYLGSPDSDRQLRIYDKAAEMNLVDSEAWVRLELELRRVRANGAFQSAARNATAPTVRAHMADYLTWGNKEYQEALNGQMPITVVIPREDTDRQKWLLGQVAVSLAQEMIADETFIQRLIEAARQEMMRLVTKK